MRKIAAFIIGFSMLASCMYKKGSGVIITQTKNVSAFTELNVGGAFDVEVQNGTAEKVVVEADDNLMKYINVDVVGNELKIRMDEMSVSDAHLKVFITAPSISAIKASAAAEITVKDGIKSEGTIVLKASSGSNIKTALDAPEVKMDASSGGEMVLSGRTKELHAESSSGSSIVATELLSENSHVRVSSGGNAEVYASVSLDASASSGGNVRYKGGATNIKKSASSGGEVEKVN